MGEDDDDSSRPLPAMPTSRVARGGGCPLRDGGVGSWRRRLGAPPATGDGDGAAWLTDALL